MKATNLNPPRPALLPALRASALAALLLATAPAGAMPSVSTISGGPSFGYANGNTAQTALFHTPLGMALDATINRLYLADRDNNVVRYLNLSGDLTFTFAAYAINQPVAVSVDASGNVFILNRGNGSNGSIVEFDSFGDFVRTLTSGLVNANSMTMDKLGNLYVTVQNNTVLEVAPDGSRFTIATIAASGTLLQGITRTDSGLLAVCDFGRNGILIINPETLVVTSLTGFNGAGDHFGTKATAKFNQPFGIAGAGNDLLVVTDYGNNRVKVVDAVGTVTNLYGVNSNYWVTGSGTYPGWWDGTVSPGDVNGNILGTVESRLPTGVLFTDDGIIYTTEIYYHLIRKVTGSGLPHHAPPPPPVPTPAVGWVAYTIPPAVVVSVLETNQPFIFNNDVTIAIASTFGTETHFTYGPTPTGVDTIPNPGPTEGSTPPYYYDGMFPYQVPPSIIQPAPDITVKAVGTQSGRQSSPIVTARFQWKTASPLLVGYNAAMFTVTDGTDGAELWYTTDGSDPIQGPPSVGPITNGTALSLNASTPLLFKIRAFHDHYQDSDIVSATFTPDNFVPNTISFGFSSGEASSDFIASPGQTFYAPVTMHIVGGTKLYSLQFNLTVTNAGPNPGPPVIPNAYFFSSFLVKPIPGVSPVVYERIPPFMFADYLLNPPPNLSSYDNRLAFLDLTFTNTTDNLLGVGWLERYTQTNLYDTLQQDLVKYSMPHDTLFKEDDGKIVIGGYGFFVPPSAAPGQTYRIQLGLPSATDDGIGGPGSAIYIATPTNGSFAGGAENTIKLVTAGQRKYVAGDCAPFHWFNAGDFGNTNLDNSDVMQVFQSAIYGFNYPPEHSDFFDSMDSCGYTYVQSPNGYLLPGTLLNNPLTQLNPLFGGNDTTINQIAFGDGQLDICDVYVTFRRSLDPSLKWFRRFWTNGVLAAEMVGANPGPASAAPLATTNPPSVNFTSGDIMAAAGQTVQIPITAKIFGNYPLRAMLLNLNVVPLDGSPALTTPVTFTANLSLGQVTFSDSKGNGNYAGAWLNSSVSGLTGNPTLGMLTIRIPTNATASSAYAIHFDHASASPNGLASFPKKTATGLITLSDRSGSSYFDGIPDSWRLRYFGTLYNLLSLPEADADGDGASNAQEYAAGTDPNDATSCLRVSTDQAMAQQPKDCVIHWPSVAGKHYVIERSTSLFSPVWSPVSTNTGTGADMEYHDSTGGNVRFYRVHLQ